MDVTVRVPFIHSGGVSVVNIKLGHSYIFNSKADEKNVRIGYIN